jgi:hypothetical protein
MTESKEIKYFPFLEKITQEINWVEFAAPHREEFMELLKQFDEEAPTLTNLLFSFLFDLMGSDNEAKDYILNSVPSDAVQYVIDRIDNLEQKKKYQLT